MASRNAPQKGPPFSQSSHSGSSESWSGKPQIEELGTHLSCGQAQGSEPLWLNKDEIRYLCMETRMEVTANMSEDGRKR